MEQQPLSAEPRLACLTRLRTRLPSLSWRSLLLAAFCAAALAVLVLSFVDSPLQRTELSFLEYVQNDLSTAAGACVLWALSAVFVSVGLPSTPINLAAGFILGPYIGTAVCITGLTAGALVAFALSRTVMKKWAEDKATSHPKFGAISAAVARKGFVFVFLLRLSPVMPVGLCCYVLGVTQVGWLVFTAATFLGELPFTAAYCYIGTLISDISSIWTDGSGSDDYNPLRSKTATIVWAVVALTATIAVIVATTFITKRAMNASGAEYQALGGAGVAAGDIEEGTVQGRNELRDMERV
eukprot:m51a1_g13758 hypothetical protein (297) ;mRNA; f:229092-230386